MRKLTPLFCILALTISGCAANHTSFPSEPTGLEVTDAITFEETVHDSSVQITAVNTSADIQPIDDSTELIPEDISEEAEPVIPTVTESTSSTTQISAASIATQTTTIHTTVTTTTTQTESIPSKPEIIEYETWEFGTSEKYYTEEPYMEEPTEGDIYEPVMDVPVYSDSNLGDYVLLTVVPEKIYWNELDYFHPTEGKEFTMLFPSFFYETFKESDSVMLRFNPFERGSSQRKESLKSQCGGCDFVYSYVRPSDSWQKDMLFPIKDGVLSQPEYEKYIKSYFNAYDAKSWVMSDHGNEFYYGMTVDEVDSFMANQHAECVEAEEYWNKIIEEDPNNAVDFEMSHSYFTWGMVMRVRLAETEIYQSLAET